LAGVERYPQLPQVTIAEFWRAFACHSFAADGLDYRQDAAQIRIRPSLHGRHRMGVPEAEERARTIRVAEIDSPGFGCCQHGRCALGDHLTLSLGDGGEDMDC